MWLTQAECLPERRLAAAVIRQAFHDLAREEHRASALLFLRRDLWATALPWSALLEHALIRRAVIAQAERLARAPSQKMLATLDAALEEAV